MMRHSAASDNESAYRVLIDKGNFHNQTRSRAQRTKSLLSGGAGPRGPPSFSRSRVPARPHPASMGPPQQQQQPGYNRPGGKSFLGRDSLFGQPRPNSGYQRPGNFYGQSGAGAYQRPGGLFGKDRDRGAGGGMFDWNWNRKDGRRKSRSRFGLGRSTTNSSSSDSSSSDSYGRRHRRKSKRNRWISTDSSDSDSDIWKAFHGSKRKHRRSKGRRRRRKDRYGVSDSGSSSDSSSSGSDYHGGRRKKRLSGFQKKIIWATLQEYCGDKMTNTLYKDLVDQMEEMENKGFRLPSGYDKSKHDIGDNEMKLYRQLINQHNHRSEKKVSNMINISAQFISWFCQMANLDILKTRTLPRHIRQALEEGDFDESLEGVGGYLQGTVLDHPLFSAGITFLQKMGEAHEEEQQEIEDKLEEEMEQKDDRMAEGLRNLNKFRTSRAPNGSAAKPKPRENSQPFGMPAPGSKTTRAKNKPEKKKKQKKQKKPSPPPSPTSSSCSSRASSPDLRSAPKPKPKVVAKKDTEKPKPNNKKENVVKKDKLDMVKVRETRLNAKPHKKKEEKEQKNEPLPKPKPKPPTPKIEVIEESDLSSSSCSISSLSEASSSKRRKKKNKKFEAMPGLAFPKQMGQFVNMLQGPVSQFADLMSEEDPGDEKLVEIEQQKHSLSL